MDIIRQAVGGVRNGVQMPNNPDDLQTITTLFDNFPFAQGGTSDVPGPWASDQATLIEEVTAQIFYFQKLNNTPVVDGVVDREGTTLRLMSKLAGTVLIQSNPDSLTSVHDVPNQVISPYSLGDFFQEIPQTGSMSEFLFKMLKDGEIYWIGAAVPAGTADFSKVQIFFHPTVVQDGQVVAADGDYRDFRGGWSNLTSERAIQRYVAMQGGQLAGARQTALVVPFMTMAAYGGTAPAYMFATSPVDTLNAIMTAVQNAAVPGSSAIQVSQVGVSSFSSGIGAMRLFIRTFQDSGLIVETTDFDSPFIITEPRVMTRSPGAVGRVFSQVPPLQLTPGWAYLPPQNFRDIQTFKPQGVHAQIGWMMFFVASGSSVIV
jgi:hypothetical protein